MRLGVSVIVLGAATACSDAVPTTQVSVRAQTRDGVGVPNQSIVFSGADGRLFAHEHTDEDGRAVGPMEPGGMVTRYVGQVNNLHQLVTETGVSPDQELVLELLNGRRSDHRLAVQLPRPPDNATRYQVWSGCDETEIRTPFRKASLSMYADCPGQGTYVLAYAFDSEGRPVAYALASDVREDAEHVSLPMLLPFTRTATVVLSRPPTGTSDAGASLAPTRGGLPFGRYHQTFALAPRAQLQFGLPNDFGEDLAVTMAARLSQQIVVSEWVVSATTTRIEADGTQIFLPLVRDVALSSEDRVLRWAPDAGLEIAEVIDVELTWPRGNWYFSARDARSVAIPELPGALDADPSGPVNASVGYVDFVAYDDYQAVVTSTRGDVRARRSSFGFTP